MVAGSSLHESRSTHDGSIDGGSGKSLLRGRIETVEAAGAVLMFVTKISNRTVLCNPESSVQVRSGFDISQRFRGV